MGLQVKGGAIKTGIRAFIGNINLIVSLTDILLEVSITY